MALPSPQSLQYQERHKHENRGPDVIVSLAIMLTMAYVAVGLRFLSRRMVRAKLWFDDWVMVIGLFLLSCYVTVCFVLVSMGLGKHIFLIKKRVPFAQGVLAAELLHTPASTVIKFSILLHYRRLFPGKKFRNVLWAIAGFLIIFTVARMLSLLTQCTPIAALWNRRAHSNAHCNDFGPALIVFAVVNTISDIAILILPMPILWHLHVDKTRRKQLIGVFGLGGLVCVVSICRPGLINQISLSDPSWDDVTPAILSGIENSAGVISGCLPTMLPIWNYLRHGQTKSLANAFKLTPASGQHTEPKVSNVNAPLWTGCSKYDACVTPQDGPFQRLQEEGVDEQDDSRQPTPPPMAIRVTTKIAMS